MWMYVGVWGLCIRKNQILMMIVEKKTMKSKAVGACPYNTCKCLRPRYQSRPFDISSLTEVCSPLNMSIMKASHHTLSVSIISQSLVLPVANPEAEWIYLHIFFSLTKRHCGCTWKDVQPVKLAYVTFLSLYFKTGVTSTPWCWNRKNLQHWNTKGIQTDTI